MKKWLIALLPIILSACQGQEETNKVILVNTRGASYSDINKFLEKQDHGVLDTTKLRPLKPITNAVTITNIASYETGSYPAAHGIVGHLYVLRDRELKVVSGFNARFSVPAFWEVADEAGMKVLNIGSLTLHGHSTNHINVDCMAQGRIKNESQFIQLIPETIDKLHYRSLDMSDERKFYTSSNENTLFVDNDSDSSNGFLTQLVINGWGKVTELDTSSSPTSYGLKWLKHEGDTITLYQRSTFSSRGYPQSFINQVDSILGPANGWPNIPAYTSGQLSIQTLIEEIDFEIYYVMNAFKALSDLKDYELIMVDYPLIDRYGHLIYRLAQTSDHYSDLLKSAYKRLFNDLKIIQEYAKKNGFSLIVSSGHGFSGIHSSININALLEAEEINTDVSQTDWEAVGIPGKVSSHIYLNPKLEEQSKQRIIQKIKSIKNTTHSSIGRPFIEEIYESSELYKIQMDHTNAGDVFMLLKPGYVFQNEFSAKGDLVTEPVFLGDHGYSPIYEEAKGFIYSTKDCINCSVVDIKGMVLNELNLQSSFKEE